MEVFFLVPIMPTDIFSFSSITLNTKSVLQKLSVETQA